MILCVKRLAAAAAAAHDQEDPLHTIYGASVDEKGFAFILSHNGLTHGAVPDLDVIEE
jgi:hypothetical protein